MAAEYRLTAEAEDDLQGIADYTFETFGPAQAEAYGLGLRNCFASLIDNPLLGRDYGFLRPGLRRYEHESHSVYYQLTDTGILILRVLHQRMDPARHL